MLRNLKTFFFLVFVTATSLALARNDAAASHNKDHLPSAKPATFREEQKETRALLAEKLLPVLYTSNNVAHVMVGALIAESASNATPTKDEFIKVAAELDSSHPLFLGWMMHRCSKTLDRVKHRGIFSNSQSSEFDRNMNDFASQVFPVREICFLVDYINIALANYPEDGRYWHAAALNEESGSKAQYEMIEKMVNAPYYSEYLPQARLAVL